MVLKLYQNFILTTYAVRIKRLGFCHSNYTGLTPPLKTFIMLFMYFVYVLKMNNGQIYIGFTDNIQKRIKKHNEGSVFTTSKYLPVKLVYFECYLAKQDALQREKMIKRYGSTWTHLKRRISHSLKGFQGRG